MLLQSSVVFTLVPHCEGESAVSLTNLSSYPKS